MDAPNRNCAIRLAAAELAVHPCDPQKRTPLLEGWPTLSSSDAATVAAWWTRWPGAVPALDLAKCGLLVLDGDRHDPKVDGVAALRQLLNSHGVPVAALPMVKTPRDGVHVYFKQPDPPLGNARDGLPGGIDVRGAGGYVIAPGARLANRRSYQPIAKQPELAAAFVAQSIPAVPAEIVALLKPVRQARARPQQQRRGAIGTRERNYALAALRRIAKELGETPAGGRNQALNKAAFLAGQMAARGWLDEDEIEDALSHAMADNGYLHDKGEKAINATLRSGLAAGLQSPHDDLPGGGLSLDDFVAFMPAHHYIFTPCREPWPAASVDAKLGKVTVTDASGATREVRASAWLDRHRSVEQMTWAPGKPLFIPDRLVVLGGWIERSGVNTLNLYRPPTLRLGDAADADPWLDHVHKVYPGNADHIVQWLAHRVQRPGEKVNHALVLGGVEGIGKDTLLEPIKYAVGPWNFYEISPHNLLGRFNAYLKAVVLRVSEARDAGELDRYALHDRLKVYTAAPPDVLRVDEKHLREYYIPNCVGLVITTNYRTDALYLPPTDRRHYVAWSSLAKDDFAADYWTTLWGWYANGGHGHVAAYLADLDLGKFDPKAPPPQTPAFWDVVDAGSHPEDAELADVLDELGRPQTITLAEIRQAATGDFYEWLGDRKNRRGVSHRLERCGYVRLHNDEAGDGLWRISQKRQSVYVKASLSVAERNRIAERLRKG